MTLTFCEKEIRKNRKKARESEGKYKKTGNTDFLSKRDEFNDIAVKLESNMETDIQKKKVKKQTKVSDEQAFSEAQAYNRKIKKKAEEESQNTSEINRQMKNRRQQLLKKLKDRGIYKKEFIEKQKSENEIRQKQLKEYRKKEIMDYMEKNPGSTHSEAQKYFMRKYNNAVMYMDEKERIIQKIMMLGMDREKAEETFQNILENKSQ